LSFAVKAHERERVGVRGYKLSVGITPSPGASAPTSPHGRGEADRTA
jgi:hypothetical protein